MRIAHIITGLGVGGAERVVLDLCSQLARDGHDMAVWSLTPDTGALTRGLDSRVRIHVLGVTGNPLTWPGALARFLRSLGNFSPDVLHAHMFHGLVAALIVKSIYRSLPVIFTSHSNEIRSNVRRALIRATKRLRRADVVFDRGQHRNLNANAVHIIANGVDTNAIDRTDRGAIGSPCRFINVARFTEPKNHFNLLRQFKCVIQSGVDAELWLVGDGPLGSEIETMVRVIGLEDRVKLLGRREDVMQLLRVADVFIMSSKWEGLPIAMLEAGLAALPVISTPVGAVPSLLANDCGVLAEVHCLADRMCAAVADWPAHRAMGMRLRKRIEDKYSLRAMADAHGLLYLEVAHRASVENCPQ